MAEAFGQYPAMETKGHAGREAGTTLRVSEVTSLVGSRARVRTRPGVGGLAENLDLYPRDAAAHSKRGGGARRKIDNSSLNMRATIIDPDPHRLAIVEVGDPDLGA